MYLLYAQRRLASIADAYMESIQTPPHLNRIFRRCRPQIDRPGIEGAGIKSTDGSQKNRYGIGCRFLGGT